MYGTYACSSQGLSQEGRLKQQIQFQTTFLSTSHHSNQTKATHRHTHVGSTAGKTIIRSGGDTTLKGAQLIGKGVQADTRNLHIESVQDSETYQGKQQNAGAQVTVGYGFSASGSYSQSKINAEHQSVSEQSGIYAGDAGYQVNVKQHTQLDGGIITSSQSAEDNGKNRFSTGTLTTSDIKNHSRYEGKSFGLGASATISGKTLGQGEQNKPQDSHLTSVADKNGTSSSVGYGSDRDNQSSVTKSSINTQNIRITDEAKQIQLTGKTAEETQAQIHTDTTTETAQELSGSLKNVFDKDRVQSELDLQRAVIQDFSQTSQQAGTEINRKAKEHNDKAEQLAQAAAKADAEGNKELAQALAAQADDARKKAASWQRGGVLLNMISAGLSAPTQSTAGIMAATASPALSYEIGQHFKGKNAEGTSAHILAHAVLGAAVAATGDNNALAGAISAGGAEAAAPYISKWLYGKEKGSDLTAEEKETVTAITNLLGTATGAVIGDTTANAVQGSLNAQSAVENNSGVIPAPIPLPIYIPKTQAQKEADERVAIAIQKTGRETIKTISAGNAALWSGLFCQFDSGCESSLAAMNGVWNEHMGNNESEVAAIQTTQTSTGLPMPDPDDENKKPIEHAKQRREEAKTDAHRSVGDSNRIVREGRKFLDTETGNYVYVKGDRIVIQSPEGRPISQFKNPRNNTQNRVRSGRWKPL